MKRVLTIAFLILMLCCLLLANIGFAAEEGYSIDEAYGAGGVELDGEWGTEEWDSSIVWIENIDPSDARFGYKMAGMDPYYMAYIIDCPSDNTDDAGDIWQICLDGDASDGDAPDSQDNKVEVVGHETVTVYVGDGSDWVEMQGADLQWNESLTTTLDVTPYDEDHYVLELMVDKGSFPGGWGANPPPHGLRIAMYDESEDSWIAWPPASDQNVPDGWGRIQNYGETVPESLSIGVVALLSSVAVAVIFYSRRNRKKLPKE